MPVVKTNNLLVEHWLSIARNKDTDSKLFVTAVENIGSCLFSEIICNIKGISTKKDVKTPLKRTKGTFVDQKKIYFVPILRAGLAMLGGLKNLVPEAKIAHVGLFRTQKTLEPRWYMDKLPKKFSKQANFIILEPMLATGGTLTAVLSRMEELGIKKKYVLSMLISRKAKLRLEKQFPDVKILVAGIDPVLNDHGYIVPGLGDAGDRAFNM